MTPAITIEAVAIDSLPPGTVLRVRTRNSEYRFVILDRPRVLVQGGSLFTQAAVVCFEGATDGGQSVKQGWILVGSSLVLQFGVRRIRSSRVRSIAIEAIAPAVDERGS